VFRRCFESPVNATALPRPFPAGHKFFAVSGFAGAQGGRKGSLGKRSGRLMETMSRGGSSAALRYSYFSAQNYAPESS